MTNEQIKWEVFQMVWWAMENIAIWDYLMINEKWWIYKAREEYLKKHLPKEKEEQNIYIKLKDTKWINVKCIEKEGDTEEFDLWQPKEKEECKCDWPKYKDEDWRCPDCWNKPENKAIEKLEILSCLKNWWLVIDKINEVIDHLNKVNRF